MKKNSLIFMLVVNIVHAGLFFCGVHFSSNFTGIAMLFPIVVLVAFGLLFSKEKLGKQLLILSTCMMTLWIIQNLFAYIYGDDGAQVFVLFFSFLCTVIPYVLYIITASIIWIIKKIKPLKIITPNFILKIFFIIGFIIEAIMR